MLKVCPNGARELGEHPALSSDPETAAKDCAEAVLAGAQEIHVHPKNRQRKDSLEAHDVDLWVATFRQHCPGVPLGITTGEWAAPDLNHRLNLIDSWNELPDFASVNWHESGADRLAARLLERGIGVEAGIWHEEGLASWSASPLRANCFRVLVEVQDMPSNLAESSGKRLVEGVQSLEPTATVLLHGEEESTWSMVSLAGRLGLESRIGLEDCLHLPDGRTATGNAELVEAALQLMRAS